MLVCAVQVVLFQKICNLAQVLKTYNMRCYWSVIFRKRSTASFVLVVFLQVNKELHEYGPGGAWVGMFSCSYVSYMIHEAFSCNESFFCIFFPFPCLVHWTLIHTGLLEFHSFLFSSSVYEPPVITGTVLQVVLNLHFCLCVEISGIFFNILDGFLVLFVLENKDYTCSYCTNNVRLKIILVRNMPE